MQGSIETAREITKLAHDIGITNLAIVGNKVRSNTEKEYIISHLPDFEFLGFIPFDQAIVDADIANRSVLEASQNVNNEIRNIYQVLLRTQDKTSTGKNG